VVVIRKITVFWDVTLCTLNILTFRENLLPSPSEYNNEEVRQLVHITLQHPTLFLYFILNHSKYINMMLCILKGAKYQFSTDVVYTYVAKWSITSLIYHFTVHV
jgi:hypothetical protein